MPAGNLTAAHADDNRLRRMLVIRSCMGSESPWEWYRTFEAVARTGHLTAAAKALGVSQSTVSRQLSRLEENAGSLLILRESPVRLTERGALLLEAIRPMVDGALAAGAALENTPELRGEVTITTVGEVVRWVLSRRLGGFFRDYPHLRLRILASNRNDSLAAGEADIALRLARPERGKLTARRLSVETFGFYAASSLELHEEVAWVGLTGSLAQIPEQRHARRAFASRPARVLVEDVEALGFLVEAGTGVAVLPRQLAARLRGVEEVRPARVGARDLGSIPSRSLFMVVHQSKRDLPAVRAVSKWLAGIFSDD